MTWGTWRKIPKRPSIPTKAKPVQREELAALLLAYKGEITKLPSGRAKGIELPLRQGVKRVLHDQ